MDALWNRCPSHDVIATPLYLDRAHPLRDQLRPGLLVVRDWSIRPAARSTRIPTSTKALVDGSTLLHVVPRYQVYYWLGLFNSAVVEAILCRHYMSPMATWMSAQHVRELPVPSVSLLPLRDSIVDGDALLRLCLHHLADNEDRPSSLRHICGTPDLLVHLVSASARYTEALRYDLAAAVEAWQEGRTKKTPQSAGTS